MPRLLFHTDFKTVRASYLEVKAFLEGETMLTVPSLKIKIENDLACTGEESILLIEKFVSKYKLDPGGFEFSKHFQPESDPTGTFLNLSIALPIRLTIWLIKILSFGKLNFTNINIESVWEPETLDLTFGDMLTWYLTGKYILRQNVQVVINT